MTHNLHPVWFNWPQVKTLTAAFAAASVPLRFVGGCVRDALLDIPVSDIDAATPLAPEQVIALLNAAKIRAVPTGIDHGTVTAVIEGKGIEITTLRRDVSTDGRHAEVEYTDDWKADAARRDFTINAFYLSSEGELFDYFGGLEDLKAGQVRFIGDADARIREDTLRILRFFRFYARHGRGLPDAKALAACAAAADQMSTLSGERIQEEMLKLLSIKKIFSTLQLMQQGKSLEQVLGFSPTSLDALLRLEEVESISGMAPDRHVRLGLLLMAAPFPAEAALKRLIARWKLSNAISERLHKLVATAPRINDHMSLADQKKLLRQCEADIFKSSVMARWAREPDIVVVRDRYRHMLLLAAQWAVPKFPVTGNDLKKKGMPEGKPLGVALHQLEELWEESDYRLTKEELLAKAKTC